MRLPDFQNLPFECFNEKELSEWVLCGEHYPKVKTYKNTETNEWFQVYERGNLYRKTPPAGPHEVVAFDKEWKKLDD